MWPHELQRMRPGINFNKVRGFMRVWYHPGLNQLMIVEDGDKFSIVEYHGRLLCFGNWTDIGEFY